MAKKHTGLSRFSFVQLVHSLFGADLLNSLLTGDPKTEGNRAATFRLPRGLSLSDEIARAGRIALGAFQTYREQTRSTAATEEFVRTILTEAFGYQYTPCNTAGELPDIPAGAPGMLPGLETAADAELEARYPITAFLSFRHTKPELPLLIVPENRPLDRMCEFPGRRRKTPFALMQEYLDKSDRFLWGIVTNGTTWRILRDSTSVALSAYLDFRLGEVLESRDTEAFAAAYRLFHASRPARQNETEVESCLWEKWRKELEIGGERVREGLSSNVQESLRALGCGFLGHPANTTLRQALRSGELSPMDYYNELLRLVYRFIFLFVMEERELLHAHIPGAEAAAARDIYRKGYSMARLTPRALANHNRDHHDDLWQSVRIVFTALGQDTGEPLLALPALGGLFDAAQCPHLDAAELPNSVLCTAMRLLRWSAGSGQSQLLPIDYRNMGSEELGSVYEELLELTPQINLTEKRFSFTGDISAARGNRNRRADGNKRKTTGSYYTPPCLVELLVHNALDPLIGKCRRQAPPGKQREALLSLRIIDPACGSGHFLLAAARHLAQAVAEVSGSEPERQLPAAMHDVIARCIYGVDLNPMAIELVRMNLWLEGYQPNKPLSFLDNHLICGNSLLGITSWEELRHGIPADPKAKALPGDNAAVFSAFKKKNKQEQAELAVRTAHLGGFSTPADAALAADEQSPTDVRRKSRHYLKLAAQRQRLPQALAADALIGSFLLPKQDIDRIPTTRQVLDAAAGLINGENAPAIADAVAACRRHKVLHWPLIFPEAMESGGFDCVLGNPPWEKNKLADKEWFAQRYPLIANAPKANIRKKYIRLLSEGKLRATLQKDNTAAADTTEMQLHEEYLRALSLSAATTKYFTWAGMRYPLTGSGDLNLYALFAETALNLMKDSGRAGILLPSGLATDKNTSRYFRHLVTGHRLSSLNDFENKSLFPGVHSSYKFSAFTIAQAETISAAFFLHHPRELAESERCLTLTAEDFCLLNPNSATSALPRSRKDADLLLHICKTVPVFVRETPDTNPWGVQFARLFDMTNDSKLFREEEGDDTLPLYEGKMVHLYDHRWASPQKEKNNSEADEEEAEEDEEGNLITAEQKQDSTFMPQPRYWVRRADIISKLAKKKITILPPWFMGFRTITNATNERTLIPALLPFCGAGNSLSIIILPQETRGKACCLYANLASIVQDYIVRCKLGGSNMNLHYVQQFPVLPPAAYSAEAEAYITERVVRLVYTADNMRPFAADMGYRGAPFAWDENERALLRAELDAVYAKLYGLSRADLAYILDPTTYYGDKCPTVTFPTLQANEIKAYGEYRTQRLVLEAYDRVPDFTLPR